MVPRSCLLIALVLCLALPALAAQGDNSVGMNIHVGRQGFIDACADLGVGWVRMDANWFQLEPSRDVYDYALMDIWVDRAHQAGLKVYLTLAYTPAWEDRHGDTDGLSHNDPPNDSVEFVHDTVAYYRAQGVTHFGIWNESNLQGFFEGSVQEYVNTILLPGAAAVDTGCQAASYNDCLVLGPDLANVGDADIYLEDTLALAKQGNGGQIPFDIIAHHTYQDFAETGWTIFSGDSFINVLDDQRCPFFCRKDLRQILDAAGWTGEVWITETGYRAQPPGDATEEDLQAVYVTRVLEEQLLRAWYTNTFFYEIFDCKPDQPECGIDGYGLMRATAGTPGSRNYPADYRRKPAFWALQQFIIDHPEIIGTEPPKQCGDGQDNDGDGLVDGADRGCADAFDDDESDDPPRERIEVYRTPGMQIDGDLADLGPDGWLDLGPASWHGTEALGVGDLDVRLAARWSDSGLALAIEVTDDVHDNDRPAPELWLADSLQIAFDMGQSGGEAYDNIDDHEINAALVAGQVSTYRFHGPAGASDQFQVAIARTGQTTAYEVLLDAADLPGLDLTVGAQIGFSFLVNDADGIDRVGWKEWTPGVGMQKAPAYFGELTLLAEQSGPGQVDGGTDGSDGEQDAGPDASSDGDSDPGTDTDPIDGGSDAGQDAGGDEAPADMDQDGGMDPDTDMPDAGTADEDEDGGCTCSVSDGRQSSAGLLLLLLLGWVGVWRARQTNQPTS